MLTFLIKAGHASAGEKLTRFRRVVGLLIILAGLTVIIGECVEGLSNADSSIQAAMGAGGIAAMATAIGTLPVLFAQGFSQRSYDCMLGFGAGVMLGATAFSLIIPALAASRAAGASQMSSSAIVGGAILGGAVLTLLMDSLVSRNSVALADRHAASESLKHAWMFVAAVALHNVPEGLAIGVAYAGPDLDGARTLATAISIQDVPEGLVVALALRTVGYGRVVSAFLGAASGLVEPLAAGVGAVLIGLATDLLPVGLALAAGAMLFVIVHNVIPESHKNGNATASSVGLTCGFALMTVLDTALG